MSPRAHLTGVLRHPAEPRILLLRSDRTWRLPRVVVSDPTWIADAEMVIPAFERRLGTRAWLLRHLGFAADDDADRLDAAHELELLDRSWRPPANGRWVGRAELDRLRLDGGERAMMTTYLEALEQGEVPAGRPPWSLPGWRDDVLSWLGFVLPGLGRRLVDVQQVKHWSISAVLRVATDRDDLYLKASARLPLFVDEGAVTARLAERFPGYVPPPVAVEPERGWMLFDEFELPGWEAPLETRCEAFRRFAGLQVQSAASVKELLADGCHDRRLDVLEHQLAALVGDRPALHKLSAAEVRQVRRLAPRVSELCRRLAALGLPATLVHGDLHIGNVARLDGQLAYFDWTDACVTHPFVDLHSLQWQRDEAARAALLDAYLEPWRRVADEDVLRDAVALAAVVTPLHHAVSYWTITGGLEPASKPELDAVDTFLREALARAREVPS